MSTPEPIKRIDWSTVLTAVFASFLTLGAALVMTGKAWGTSAADIDGLKQQYTKLEERQIRLEALVLERLDKNSEAIGAIGRQLSEHQGETKALMGLRQR